MIRRPPRSTLFPTRRSSDLLRRAALGVDPQPGVAVGRGDDPDRRGAGVRGDLLGVHHAADQPLRAADRPGDRKSTRLNSSHVEISYAVFCLKKKKKKKTARE